MDPVRTSKLLSRVLRHDPAAIGITLEPGGWVEVDTLLAALRAHGHRLSPAELRQLVSASDKQRFALDPATDRIRAHQGHSLEVDLGHGPGRSPVQRLGQRRLADQAGAGSLPGPSPGAAQRLGSPA